MRVVGFRLMLKVVTDKFIDPQEGLMDHDGDPSWLDGCELLHQVAERQGVRTAALGWWGQTSRADGALATYVSATAAAEQRVPRDPLAYPPDAERAREIRLHLERPDGERPRLVLAYFRGPDHAAHFTGLAIHQPMPIQIPPKTSHSRLNNVFTSILHYVASPTLRGFVGR